MTENGQWAQGLGNALGAAGSIAGQVLGAATADLQAESGVLPTNAQIAGASAAGGMIGNSVGQAVGHTLGGYIDNIDSVTQNVQTFLQEANDPQSWIPPSLTDF
jgi:hypothetical protein